MTIGGPTHLLSIRMPDIDDAYHEYLWGESSPRSFARKARAVSAKEKVSRQAVEVEFDAHVDLAQYV